MLPAAKNKSQNRNKNGDGLKVGNIKAKAPVVCYLPRTRYVT